jgi:hypothetical protein
LKIFALSAGNCPAYLAHLPLSAENKTVFPAYLAHLPLPAEINKDFPAYMTHLPLPAENKTGFPAYSTQLPCPVDGSRSNQLYAAFIYHTYNTALRPPRPPRD